MEEFQKKRDDMKVKKGQIKNDQKWSNLKNEFREALTEGFYQAGQLKYYAARILSPATAQTNANDFI